MSEGWPLVPLGEVLHKSNVTVPVEADQTYTQVTVRLWGQGVVPRNVMKGAEIAAPFRYVVRPQQFILSRIDARNGAFGLVPDLMDGAVVSNDFPVFNVDAERLSPSFLNWMSKTHDFIDLCKAASEGTTNRVRLKEGRFLATAILLPPLGEQQRIVARIEELAGKIEQAQSLKIHAAEAMQQIMAGEERSIWPDSVLTNAPTLRDVTIFLSRGRQSKQGQSNHYLIKTQHVQMGKYVRTNLTLDADVAASVAADAMVQPGDILIACSAAGCLGRVAFYLNADRIASTDTHIAIARAERRLILPEYLYAYLCSAPGQYQLRSRERGDWKREKVGFRLTELNLRDLEQVPIPAPSLNEQRNILARLDNFRTKVEAVKALQAQTQAELDALMPSILDRAFRGEL